MEKITVLQTRELPSKHNLFDQEKELREQLHVEIEKKSKACSNPTYECSIPRLDGYEFCIRHILKDPRAPFRPCAYTFSNGKKCPQATPKHDRKKDPSMTVYCFEHSRLSQLTTTRNSIGKLKQVDTNEVLLNGLSHHLSIEPSSPPPPPSCEVDEEIDVVSPNIQQFVNYEQISDLNTVNSLIKKKRRILDYASDSSTDVEPVTLQNTSKGHEWDISDDESVDSQDEDLLKHAGIYTNEEALAISKKKLINLQNLYMEQINRLHHILKEKRRRYLHSIRKERETLCSIHEQQKRSPGERSLYEKLKALNHYHRRHGIEAVLHRKFKEKRAKTNDGNVSKGLPFVKCIFTEGGVKCGERTMPSCKYCRKHILEDKKQILFRACGVEKSGVVCQEPVPNIFEDATCVLHISLPTKKQYIQKKYESETEEDDEDISAAAIVEAATTGVNSLFIKSTDGSAIAKKEEPNSKKLDTSMEIDIVEEPNKNVTISHDEKPSEIEIKQEPSTAAGALAPPTSEQSAKDEAVAVVESKVAIEPTIIGCCQNDNCLETERETSFRFKKIYKQAKHVCHFAAFILFQIIVNYKFSKRQKSKGAMTKFIAYYSLCPIHDTKEFLGLSPDSDSGNIIATLGRNIAIVIKISTQKQIRSWSMLEKFSSKVVYDHKSQQYVGVIANRFLRLWDENVSDINKCKKLKFHKNIAELVYSLDETLVVYADGSCEYLSSAIQSRKEHTGDNLQMEMLSTVPIIDPKLVESNDGRKFLTYFQKEESKPLELVTVEISSSGLKPIDSSKKLVLNRTGQGVSVSGYSVIEGESSPALLTIWSDGRVFLGNFLVDDFLYSRNSPGQFVSMFNDLKVDTPLTILGLSKHCVAIYGANSTQEGGSLLLYNTQFKVIKAKQFFKIYFDYSRLWLVGSSILLAMGQNLSVVSYQMSKETLSDLVGSQISNDFSASVAAEFVNEEEDLEEHLCLAENQTPLLKKPLRNFKQKEENNKKNEGIVKFEKVADGKTVPFEDDQKFYKELNRLINQDVQVELVQIESASQDIEVNLMANFSDTGFVSEEVQIIAKQLELCGASEHEITEKLLSVLIEADMVEDIAVCLRRYTNISERILVKTLKYVLKDFKITPNENQEDSEKPLTNGDHMEVDIPNDDNELPNIDLLESSYETKSVKSRNDLINIILSCSFDCKIICSHISREIEYEEALVMLEYLYTLITSESQCLEERPDCPDKIDDDLRILRWFGVFLNTHFQKMTLSKDPKLADLLIKWDDVFQGYRKQTFQLQRISALLYNIVGKKLISKEKNYSKWYSIEEVRLF
ncbi:nucleolar protein 11-like [Eupeodes corollae]|uniref:nucleolar protein 11-like n=1 Tax=Eupeodes corollae TaxID=290404 RepID=UPI002490FE29|nr:nucleolar protein 11-like [Eupeodes corollae]